VAHRLVASGLALAGLFALALRPLIGFVLLATAVVVAFDARGAFGRGRLRAVIGFISGLWIGLAGVVGTLLGMLALPASCDPTTTACDTGDGNFLFAPGLLLLALGLTLLAWSIAQLIRERRAR
jgi:hypothetical protein